MGKNNVWGDLDGLSGELDESYNPFDYVLDTHSPSFNYLFGNTHGLPLGASVVLIGPPKGGKTLIANDFIAKLHESDPNALAIKFDTELRSSFQSNTTLQTGIDKSRLRVWETNRPNEIFDRIEKDIAAFQEKSKNQIKLIVIDSLTGIAGRRSLNADSVDQQQIGDEALTIGTGLKRIMPILRRYKIALVATVHIRAELDRLEQMRGHTTKAAMPYAAKHTFEYFVNVEPNQTKDGKVFDEEKTDLKDKAIQTGHKILAKMTESSCSPKGRIAEFTLDYNRGIVNIGAEVAQLTCSTGVVKRPNNRTYEICGLSWNGRTNYENALEEDLSLRKDVLEMIKNSDKIVKL